MNETFSSIVNLFIPYFQVEVCTVDAKGVDYVQLPPDQVVGTWDELAATIIGYE